MLVQLLSRDPTLDSTRLHEASAIFFSLQMAWGFLCYNLHPHLCRAPIVWFTYGIVGAGTDSVRCAVRCGAVPCRGGNDDLDGNDGTLWSERPTIFCHYLLINDDSVNTQRLGHGNQKRYLTIARGLNSLILHNISPSTSPLPPTTADISCASFRLFQRKTYHMQKMPPGVFSLSSNSSSSSSSSWRKIKIKYHLNWTELSWAELNWTELNWTELSLAKKFWFYDQCF